MARRSTSPRLPQRFAGLAGLLALTLLAMFTLSGSSSAAGCTITWTGDRPDDSWFSGTSGADTNWSDNTFPDAADHACLGAGDTVALGTSTTVDHYTVASGATLTITSAALQ